MTTAGAFRPGTGAPVSDPAGLEFRPPARQIGDRRSGTANAPPASWPSWARSSNG